MLSNRALGQRISFVLHWKVHEWSDLISSKRKENARASLRREGGRQERSPEVNQSRADGCGWGLSCRSRNTDRRKAGRGCLVCQEGPRLGRQRNAHNQTKASSSSSSLDKNVVGQRKDTGQDWTTVGHDRWARATGGQHCTIVPLDRGRTRTRTGARPGPEL